MITPSYPSKFPIPEIFWKTESPLTEILGTVRKTTFDKIVIHHLMQVFWSWNFLKQKSPPTIFFGTVRQKSFERKSCYPPPLAIKIFDKRTFLKTKGIPYEVFWYCEKINIRQNRDTTSYAIYLMRKFSEKNVPLGVFYVVWDKEVSRESRDIPPPVIKVFDKRTFLKTEGIPYEVFRYCEKIKLRQNCDTTFNAIYLMQNFSEKKGPPRSFLCSVRQRSFERKSWYPPTSHKNFR